MNMCARTKCSSAVQDLLEMFKLAHTMCTLCAIKINYNQGSLQILIVHLVLQVIAKTLLHNNYNFNQISAIYEQFSLAKLIFCMKTK